VEDLYERDFYRWAAEQATLMRGKRFELKRSVSIG
jgi:hypothetical protein